VYAVQSGARTYYAHVVDANDPNRGAVGAVGAVGASGLGAVQETVPRLEVRPSERGIQVLADEATFPDVPDESTLTIATGTARLTLAHGKPVHVKRETKDGLAVLVVYDERGPVNLGSIGDPRSIIVATTTEGAPTTESQVTVAREENTTWFGPAPRNATRLVAVPGVDIEVYEGRTIEEPPRPDRAVVAAYTGKSCRVYLFAESGAAASTRVDVPLVARVRWHTGRSGFVEVVAQRRTEQSSAESFLEIEPGAADRTPLLYVEVFVEHDAGEIALVAPYVDRAAMRLAKRGSEYELVVPDAADRVACAIVAEREHDADVDVVWPWTTTQSPERLNAVAFAVFAGPATLTFSPDGGPFRATMRADATGTLRVRVSEADAELEAEIRDARVEVRAFIDGALFARTVTVASVADKPTELYVVGATDQWAHEMRPDLEVAPDHTPLIWLIGARQVTSGTGGTSGPGDQVEVLDLVDSEDTRVVCGAEELTRDDKLPRFFKVVDVALAASTASTVSAASTVSTVSALAVTGVPRGAVVTVTNVRAVETRFNGSLDVTLS
jgi:hypothetical protein